jgi:RNA polymerase sigma-B factor
MLSREGFREGLSIMANESGATTRELLASYRATGNQDAKERLAIKYSPLVRSLCGRFRASREDHEDLYQVGMIGLLNAIDKFDPDRGTNFPSLAIPEVLGIILNYLRDHGGLMKMPRLLRQNKLAIDRATGALASSLGHWPNKAELAENCRLSEGELDAATEAGRATNLRSLDEQLGPDEGGGSFSLSDCLGREDAEYELSLDRITLEQALNTLPLREKRIVEFRFYSGLSQRRTAQHIKVSQMHVSRLERSALRKLREALDGACVVSSSDGLSATDSGVRLAAVS